MNHHRRSAQVWRVFSRDLTVLPAHPYVHPPSEYLPLPSRPQLVSTEPRRDGRLSIPWWEVAPAEIRTCNLPIANPALYQTATSATWLMCLWRTFATEHEFTNKITFSAVRAVPGLTVPGQSNRCLFKFLSSLESSDLAKASMSRCQFWIRSATFYIHAFYYCIDCCCLEWKSTVLNHTPKIAISVTGCQKSHKPIKSAALKRK